MANGREQEELWESHKKHSQHSVDGLILTIYGLRLQPQQGRCLHLGLTTRWKQIVISNVLTCKIEGTSWLVVDGQARVVALGKPSGSGTF